MKRREIKLVFVIALMSMLLLPYVSLAKEKIEEKGPYDIPNHVLSIAKENTFPNSTEDIEVVEPSSFTSELLDGLDEPIDNPNLIKLLNETSIKPSPVGIGYRGMIYIGRWPLNYDSIDSTVNWEYRPINTNDLSNAGGTNSNSMHYTQQEQQEVSGALTNKISSPDDVRNMMLIKSKEKTNLPLSYKTVIGQNTKKDQSYNVPANKQGTLNAYAPAVNEKGQVTFGEVYIELKGTKKRLVIKNVTKQGIGAWIPIQDYVSFSFQLK